MTDHHSPLTIEQRRLLLEVLEFYEDNYDHNPRSPILRQTVALKNLIASETFGRDARLLLIDGEYEKPDYSIPPEPIPEQVEKGYVRFEVDGLKVALPTLDRLAELEGRVGECFEMEKSRNRTVQDLERQKVRMVPCGNCGDPSTGKPTGRNIDGWARCSVCHGHREHPLFENGEQVQEWFAEHSKPAPAFSFTDDGETYIPPGDELELTAGGSPVAPSWSDRVLTLEDEVAATKDAVEKLQRQGKGFQHISPATWDALIERLERIEGQIKKESHAGAEHIKDCARRFRCIDRVLVQLVERFNAQTRSFHPKAATIDWKPGDLDSGLAWQDEPTGAAVIQDGVEIARWEEATTGWALRLDDQFVPLSQIITQFRAVRDILDRMSEKDTL